MATYLDALHTWNNLSKSAREKFLIIRNHRKSLSARAFPFLPSWVRADFIAHLPTVGA